MADYYEVCIRDVTDPEEVGAGSGDAADGSLRICVALGGIEVNGHLDPSWQDVNWIALTPECAKELYELLRNYQHLWEGIPRRALFKRPVDAPSGEGDGA